MWLLAFSPFTIKDRCYFFPLRSRLFCWYVCRDLLLLLHSEFSTRENVFKTIYTIYERLFPPIFAFYVNSSAVLFVADFLCFPFEWFYCLGVVFVAFLDGNIGGIRISFDAIWENVKSPRILKEEMPEQQKYCICQPQMCRWPYHLSVVTQ